MFCLIFCIHENVRNLQITYSRTTRERSPKIGRTQWSLTGGSHAISKLQYEQFHVGARSWPYISNNYSQSARWIVGYNHLISDKREWNNCFIKNTHEISRIRPDFLYHLLKQPIFSLFLILSTRVQLPYSESIV